MLIGKELGPYLVDKELGSGAMGTVFRAKNRKTGERVAIKLMSMALGTNDAAIKRFKREVDIIKQLDHPNIVKYINSGRYHKSPFIIMEFIEGESLDHILHRRTRLPWEEVANIGIDLCAALQHAHDKGIIHRDLKPSNLMILKDGTVKLTDFGIAKDADVTALTAANSTVGTAAYMSPEQCRGVRDITHRTDLYSMGIMFYELLTGRKPFTGETPMEVFLQHANKTDYKRPAEIVLEVPIWVNTLVDQLMEKEPAKRPLNARAVAESLQLIKQKIETQRSAGVEAATKRKVDRASGDKKLDEEDKAAARAMLGKKKKVKVTPFYAKGWFTILALTLVAGLAAAGIYFAFLRTPSAETLYSSAETMLKSDSKAAREGPIADFLRYHYGHAKIGQVQAWADKIDFETLEKQMYNRRNSALKFTPSAEEAVFNKALDDEKFGRMADAKSSWEGLAAKKGNADSELHAWGLLGERYAKHHDEADAIHQRLILKAADKDAKGSDIVERTGLDAVRNEQQKKYPEARKQWENLAKTPDLTRPWLLLALKQIHALDGKNDESTQEEKKQ
jgi:serine/threonine-protein kinase